MTRMLPLLGVAIAGLVIGVVGAPYVSAQNTPQITRNEIFAKADVRP